MMIITMLLMMSLPPFSCPSSLEYLRPCALILLKIWRYISRLLTYLLMIMLLTVVGDSHNACISTVIKILLMYCFSGSDRNTNASTAGRTGV